MPIAELEKLLTQLVAEHQTMLQCLDAHQAAMRQFRLDDLAIASSGIEQSRTRIAFLETRRRLTMQQVVRLHKVSPTAPLAEIANIVPQYKLSLLRLREQLKQLAGQIARKSTVSGKSGQRVAGPPQHGRAADRQRRAAGERIHPPRHPERTPPHRHHGRRWLEEGFRGQGSGNKQERSPNRQTQSEKRFIPKPQTLNPEP